MRGHTLAVLVKSANNKAAALRFNRKELPCFTLWKNTAALEDGYVTGLEPGTNYPNLKTFKHTGPGAAVGTRRPLGDTLEPGGVRHRRRHGSADRGNGDAASHGTGDDPCDTATAFRTPLRCRLRLCKSCKAASGRLGRPYYHCRNRRAAANIYQFLW